MKIRLHSIPPHDGLDVDFELTAEQLGLGKEAHARRDESLLAPIACHAHLEHSGQDVFVRLKAQARLSCLCYRCGAPFEQTVPIDTFLTCAPRTSRLKGGKFKGVQAAEDSEEGLVYFEHHELDLGEMLREQVLLALPMRYLCRADCEGPAELE